MWYGVVGAPDLLGHSCAVLPDIMHMEVDGVHVPLPDDIEGLMLLNITSYMGGVNLWTCGQPQDSQKHQMDYSSNRSVPSTHSYGVQSMCDGMIEVVAVYGTWHLGQLQVRELCCYLLDSALLPPLVKPQTLEFEFIH